MADDAARAFFSLTPERVLEAVETDGRRATGYALALNSLENRVYEVELEQDGDGDAGDAKLVLKFYRPGRWSRAAILDEHALLAELAAEELPVVPPLRLAGGDTLGAVPVEGAAPIYFAAFPRVRGRAPEELDDDQLARLGRLVARLHLVGERRTAPDRPTLTPDTYGAASAARLAAGPWIPLELLSRFTRVAEAIVAACWRVWPREAPTLRLHGDCHKGNLLWTSTGPTFVDFDDFLAGPPVQDLWLLVPGRDEEALRQRALLAAAYQTMRRFDDRTLALVEPLRALRILRYDAWIADRWQDPAFPRTFPDFLEHSFWQREVAELEEQLARLSPAA